MRSNNLDRELKRIYKFYELNNKEREEMISKMVVDEYLDGIDDNIRFHFSSYWDKLERIKDYYVGYYEDEKFFLEILRKYGYVMENEIRCVMRAICLERHDLDYDSVITSALNSLLIQDIDFNGIDCFKYYSDELGKYEVRLATEYFKNNRDILDYIRQNDMLGHCHEHADFLTDKLPSFYTITSLCKNFFGTSFYHSYCYNKEDNVIIDLCSNSVMEKEGFDRLYGVEEIAITSNSDFDLEYVFINCKKTTKTTERDIFPVLKLALYKQYLSSIGYNGELRDAPSLKRCLK